jgi:2'-5' RNA ligase
MSATARLFLAVNPPAAVRERLAGWARGALGSQQGRGTARPLRLLHPDLLHLTVCFLGSRSVADSETIPATLRECATPVGELSIGAPLWLPPRRPRALAVELHDPSEELTRLHEAVCTALAVVNPGSRRFRPHITLARMREGAAPRDRELPPTPAVAFTPTDLVLYRSWLDPEGATYEPLASVTLVPA